MAYEVPPQWARGNTPTAALMNKYKAAIDAIYALSPYFGGSVATFIGTAPDVFFTFQHSLRYLHYNGGGELTDPDDEDHTISLSDPEGGEPGVYDLSSISWMYGGKYYRVMDVSWAAEDSEP